MSDIIPADEETLKRATPPPLPPPVIGYRSATDQSDIADNSRQVYFDTITGLNARAKDNLVQLACVVVGLMLGTGIGALIATPLIAASRGDRTVAGAILGGFAGIFLSLFLSGTVIGLIRGTSIIKFMRKK